MGRSNAARDPSCLWMTSLQINIKSDQSEGRGIFLNFLYNFMGGLSIWPILELALCITNAAGKELDVLPKFAYAAGWIL